MSPVTHFLVGWVVANTGGLNRRERAAATIAGIAPDIDGMGFIAEQLTRGWSRPLLWWSDYHHVFGHNLGFGLLEMLSTAADKAFIEALHHRFPHRMERPSG